MKKDRYPLPLISDLLAAPKKARIYTKIDLRHAYHLIRITEGNEWKTAFWTHYSSFEWLCMPFGLTNSPAAFQRFMNDIFSDLLDNCVIVYLDNILIYSDDETLHVQHVRDILQQLCQHSLFTQEDKCLFHTTSVEYLSYMLLPKGLTMADDKVKCIQDWPEPRKVHDIQSFLGLRTSTKDLLTDILPSLSHSLGLRTKASPGISPRSAETHSISLNLLSLLPQSLLTGFLTAL